jgi:hypothetical protein
VYTSDFLFLPPAFEPTVVYGNTIKVQGRDTICTILLPPCAIFQHLKFAPHFTIFMAMEMDEEDEPAVLTAVSSSARQLYSLLRCINFADKAHVTISELGLKFSVEEANTLEGMYSR